MSSSQSQPVLARLWHNEALRAAAILLFLLHACFYPCLWGRKTLLESARNAPSIVWQGAWAGKAGPVNRWDQVADPGAPAWQNEPWAALFHDQYLREKTLPLWNPYQAYGVPLAANMQSQPFFPLTFLYSLHPTPVTYNYFLLLRLFLAGFGCYLFARLFLSFLPSLTSAIACMFGGYFLLFLTIPELSVACLLPWFLFAGEYLLRRRTYSSVVWFAVLIFLVFLGGAPEPTLLFFTYSYLYFLVRVLTEPAWRSHWWPHVKPLALATVAGLGLSMFVLLPFAEYVPLSWNNHEARHLSGVFRGIGHDRSLLAVFSYFFPLLFGPVNVKIPPFITYGLRNYFGLTAFLLSLLAVSSACRRKTSASRNLRPLTIFFASVSVFVLLKRFGILVNAVGSLPGFRLLDFPKYEELLLSVSVAILSGIGLHELLDRRVSLRSQSIALVISLLVIPFALVSGSAALHKAIFEQRADLSMSILSVALPGSLLLLAAITLLWLNRTEPSTTNRVGIVFVALLSIELTANYIYPMYFQFARMAGADANPYAGAPYVRLLKPRSAADYRTVGQDGVLVPSWAAAFQISDIRYLDALYINRYFAWLQNFFPDWRSHRPELSECFRGLDEFDFANPLTHRLLQLSSVKYILATKFFAPPDPVIRAIAAEAPNQPQVADQTFTIAGDSRRTLAEHPPYTRLPYRLAVPARNAVFHFSYGIEDKAAYLPAVTFTIEVKDASGAIHPAFSRSLDPHAHSVDRRWIDGAIDLSAYSNSTVDLLFSTFSLSQPKLPANWAGWSDLHFGEQSIPPLVYKPVYNNEVRISQVDDILPRAALFYKVAIEPDDAAVLKHLADLAFNPFSAAVLNTNDLASNDRNAIAALQKVPAKPLDAASIVSYGSRDVVIDAVAQQPALLLLNDAAYPGWRAKIDGRDAPLLTANYYFRAVLLSAGRHRVRFVYRPRSFYLGAALSLATALSLLAGFFFSRSFHNLKRSRSEYRRTTSA